MPKLIRAASLERRRSDGHAPKAPARVPVSAASHEDRQVPSLSVVAGPLPGAGKTPSGASRKAAAVALLQDVLARGAVSVRDIERRAVEAGVLSKGTPLGKAKVFRTAPKSLGIKPYQRSGKPAAGWLWALPNQATCEAEPAAQPTSPVREARETQAAPKSKPISDGEWVIALKFFRECGAWPDHLGPPPGESGCRAPIDVLESTVLAKPAGDRHSQHRRRGRRSAATYPPAS
jgi:hypothetical protein